MNFRITAAYEWPKRNQKTTDSELAIKKVVDQVKKRFNGNVHKNGLEYKIDFNRLRGSAGKSILDSIINRIESANVIIIDISENNRNVFLELGIALHVIRNKSNSYLYLIKKKVDNKDIVTELPGDIQGFFVSEYIVESGKVIFKDKNSLRMSIDSNVKEFYSLQEIEIDAIDEINYDEKENN